MPPKKADDSNSDIREKIKNDLFFQIFRELHSLKDQPRLQIFIAHGFLELLINTVVKAKAKNGKKITDDSRSFPYSIQLLILHEMGELSDRDYELLNWFRKLRNKAAHKPIFNITGRDLQHLVSKEFREIKNFHLLCEDLMLMLWNRNTDVLLPVFIPNLISKDK